MAMISEYTHCYLKFDEQTRASSNSSLRSTSPGSTSSESSFPAGIVSTRWGTFAMEAPADVKCKADVEPSLRFDQISYANMDAYTKDIDFGFDEAASLCSQGYVEQPRNFQPPCRAPPGLEHASGRFSASPGQYRASPELVGPPGLEMHGRVSARHVPAFTAPCEMECASRYSSSWDAHMNMGQMRRDLTLAEMVQAPNGYSCEYTPQQNVRNANAHHFTMQWQNFHRGSCMGEVNSKQLMMPNNMNAQQARSMRCFADVSQTRPSAPQSSMYSLSAVLAMLAQLDPACCIVVRRIYKLGVDAESILERHFARYGVVAKVMLTHSVTNRSKNPNAKSERNRVPSGLGFVQMSSVEEATRALAYGNEQLAEGIAIKVQKFEQRLCRA